MIEWSSCSAFGKSPPAVLIKMNGFDDSFMFRASKKNQQKKKQGIHKKEQKKREIKLRHKGERKRQKNKKQENI